MSLWDGWADNTKIIPQGWQCPQCRSIYSHSVFVCFSCSSQKSTTTATTSIGNWFANWFAKCEDCGTIQLIGPKGDHHGGIKYVCLDRDACHGRGG